MFEQSLKNIDDILRADNAGSALDYIEQTSWILFLEKSLGSRSTK
ncbi:MAG: hypothetical protein AAB781_01970 [Patescibacteria group bacterium]